MEHAGEAQVNIGGRPFRMKKSFLDDLKWHKQEYYIKNLDRALLIFHSQVDDIVGIENAGKIYQAAKHPKSFISLDGADHMLTNKEDSCYVAEVISAWVHRYGFVILKESKNFLLSKPYRFYTVIERNMNFEYK